MLLIFPLGRVNMTPETVVRLSEINNIIAIKESTGDFSQLTELKSGLKMIFNL